MAGPPRNPCSLEKWGGVPPRGGGAQLQFTRSLLKRGSATGQGSGAHGGAPSRLWQCTPQLSVLATAPAYFGQVLVGTALPVAVLPDVVAVPLGQLAALGLSTDHHHSGGGAPDRG